MFKINITNKNKPLKNNDYKCTNDRKYILKKCIDYQHKINQFESDDDEIELTPLMIYNDIYYININNNLLYPKDTHLLDELPDPIGKYIIKKNKNNPFILKDIEWFYEWCEI